MTHCNVGGQGEIIRVENSGLERLIEAIGENMKLKVSAKSEMEVF